MEKNKDLQKYIKKQTSSGYSKKEIRERLIEAGWREDVINNHLEQDLKKKRFKVIANILFVIFILAGLTFSIYRCSGNILGFLGECDGFKELQEMILAR